ncbi:MAG: hypothetical protein GY705_18730 [Bacteroidetes bacterium]|nr:hypothetical protein [Bacteroidota bacterium]
MQVPDPSEWTEPDWSSVRAVANPGFFFRAWEKDGIVIGTEVDLMISPNLYNTSDTGTTFIANFIRSNSISARFGNMHGGTGFYIEVSSDYPLASDISLQYVARGEYYIVNHYPDGSDRMEFFDFDDTPRYITLKAGQSSWSILYSPGIQSSGVISTVNWGINFSEFSDKQYLYKKGVTSGLENM